MSKALNWIKDATLAYIAWVDRHPATASGIIVVLTVACGWGWVS